jgi:hypothetical protein
MESWKSGGVTVREKESDEAAKHGKMENGE